MLDLERIDGMISAGWEVLRSDFDELAFLTWRQHVCECIESLLGSEHAYNYYFNRCVSKRGSRSVLAGCGILCAVKEMASHDTRCSP
jgi:hypothetical protein